MENIMKALIKKNAYEWVNKYGKSSEPMKTWLKENEGEWVDIETKHLFTNQYNTEKYRIYDSMIDEIVDDARVGKGKCIYCGTMLNAGEVCTKHLDCEKHGIEWFTPNNTYFLRYTEGIKCIKVKPIELHRVKFGTYYFNDNFNSLGYYSISNARRTIKFKYDGEVFELHNGIGYTKVKSLDIPTKATMELKKFFQNMSVS